MTGKEGMLGNEIRLKNLKIQAVWLTLLLRTSYLISLFLLMYKIVFSGICWYIANHPKIWGLKIVCYFISCFCRLIGHNWQFSVESVESYRQMLVWLQSAECPGCFTPMAGSSCWLWAGSSVRVINWGHSMWPGFSKHGHQVPRGNISSTEFPGDPGGRNEISYELTVEALTHLFIIILLTNLVTLGQDSGNFGV